MKNLKIVYSLALGVAGATSCSEDVEVVKQPNIIYILADDLGYGDLSCNGQQYFTTPNIDAIAHQGMSFTQHYSGNTVSAPSRCSLLTGLHSGHCEIRGNKELQGDGQLPLSDKTYTIAQLLQERGYATGAFGKWGLGDIGSTGDPNNQGFDEFFGYNCQRQAHRYYPEYLWHNQQRVMLEGNDLTNLVTFAPDLIHQKALDFIRKNADRPFFAFVPIVQPHAELLVPDDEIFAKYDGKFEETPFVATQKGAEYGDPAFDFMHYCSQPKPHATFAAMVDRVDQYVGDIMALVDELGISENTLVIFTSDNGAHVEGGADPDFFDSNGPFRGYKRSMTDGGIRVPMFAMWKGRIAEGSTTEHISAFWDMLPTFAELTGAKLDKPCDGLSLLPTLLGEKNQAKHNFLYWECMGSAAIRMGDWKAIKMRNSDNIELYNIVDDLGEENNLASQHPELVARAEVIFKESHTPNLTFPHTEEEFKLWNK